RVLDLVAAIERATGAKAITQNAPLQPGDVTRTFADHGRATRAFGFTPATPLDVGIARFVDWYKDWRR
ncbi:MAG: protein CapI, partial [Hyphomonadaceae bacterium]|nr:protein CapI [Hyphomonadaceae bacterium]